jgi:conjugal transfer/entry exclusion protein
MNIRNYIPNDHIMSVNETAKWQAQMIQLLTIEINEKDKQINELQEQLEAYENMRKEAIDYLKEFGFYGFNKNWQDLLNIFNKVGGSNEK